MATSDFTPTVSEVAAHLRARTKGNASSPTEQGTFNDHTRPTGEQVEVLIPKGVRKVASRIGAEICVGDSPEKQVELYGDAQDLAAMWTAMQIELSYFPEQVGSSRSPYDQMRRAFDQDLAVLTQAVAEHCGGKGGRSSSPAHSFPAADVIGRETDW